MIIRKHGGKVFELRRVDENPRDMLKSLDELFESTPNPGPRAPTDLARVFVEDRE